MSGLLTLQIAVAAVLISSALLKIVSRTSPRALLATLAMPPWAQSAAVLVAPAEGMIGIALIFGAGIWAGSAALALCTAFVITLAAALRLGVQEACKCFGALDSSRLTPVALLRATVLMAAAVVLTFWQSAAPSTPLGITAAGNEPIAVVIGLAAALTYLATFALADRVVAFERYRKDFNVKLSHYREVEGAR